MNIIITTPQIDDKFQFYDLDINDTFLFGSRVFVKTGKLSAIDLNLKGEVLFTKNAVVLYCNIETNI